MSAHQPLTINHFFLPIVKVNDNSNLNKLEEGEFALSFGKELNNLMKETMME